MKCVNYRYKRKSESSDSVNFLLQQVKYLDMRPRLRATWRIRFSPRKKKRNIFGVKSSERRRICQLNSCDTCCPFADIAVNSVTR